MSQKIAVVNHSTVVSDGQVSRWAEMVGRQVKKDVAPVWGVDADVQFETVTPSDAWIVAVADDSNQAGALGYHEDTSRPAAFVFAADDAKYGMLASVTLSHEIIEMLVDPECNRVWKVGDDEAYIMEAADPVQDDGDGYEMDGSGVMVSDFVTPDWGVSGSSGPWDFRKLVTRPLEIRPGGYISLFRNGSWHQVFGQLVPDKPPFRVRVAGGRVHHILKGAAVA